MNRNNDGTVAQQAADMVDQAADGIRSTAHKVSGNVHDAAQSVRNVAGQAVGAVEDAYQGSSKFARDSVNYGLTQVRSCENGFENRIRRNPKTSVLLAMGLGAVIVALWKRR